MLHLISAVRHEISRDWVINPILPPHLYTQFIGTLHIVLDFILLTPTALRLWDNGFSKNLHTHGFQAQNLEHISKVL